MNVSVTGEVQAPAPATILVVDDEESIRFTFDTFLSQAGYAVLSAAKLAVAERQLAENEVDLIFCDILLPEGSGIDLLKKVHQAERDCPVVMITGQPAIDTAAAAVRSGAYDYLVKPIRKDDLLRITGKALAQRALELERRRVQAENERYRRHLEAIFSSVQDAIITIDTDGRIIAVNRAVAGISGMTDTELLHQPIDLVDNACLQRCFESVAAILAGGASIRQRQIECRSEDGSRRVLEAACSPLRNRRRQLIGATLVVRDNTRVHDLENQLRAQHRIRELIGNSAPMQRIYELIQALSDTDATVLITGESGTGKSLVARAIQKNSLRRRKPMLTVSCSALVAELLESELFGHVKGAFTGAVADKIGRFEACHQGTLFLDEIAEVSPNIQVKLLRFLQEMEFERVGASTPIKVDVRIIAATNQDLTAAVAAGRFREDLYYRLKVVEIEVPPLRQRRADIPLLARHFCQQFCDHYQKRIYGVTDEVMAAFMAYDWPGNVRELEHAIERAFVLCPAKAISLKYLPPEITKKAAQRTGKRPADDEARRIAVVLRRTDGNKAKAARLLGISRQTLYRKLRRYGLTPTA
ncbi:MAG: sigma 54-interacting transcriptional regulator [Desulfosarcinaceae bacterium]|nr:sigma 54-interacting transcriptional regulator [Desulfosarcinaceae bacterium]